MLCYQVNGSAALSLPSVGITRYQRYYTVIRLPNSHLHSSSFRLVLHTHMHADWLSARSKNCWGSLVVLNTSWLTRKGLRLRVFDQNSPRRFDRYCLQACTNRGQDPIVTRFRSSIPFRVRQPVDTFLPRYLSVHASTGHFESNDSYSQAATRDTEPLAKSYSDGVLTRLFSIHFQYARTSLCSPKFDVGNSAKCCPCQLHKCSV